MLCYAGTLPLRYCAARFACSTPTWRLPVSGHVDDLVAASIGAVREVDVDGVGREFTGLVVLDLGKKNSTEQKKTLHTSLVLW